MFFVENSYISSDGKQWVCRTCNGALSRGNEMVALPFGKRCLHGTAINVPSSICTMLPRLPSQSELIALKLKRKLVYRGDYMYDYVSSERVMNAG